jgi:hypothetical protein
MLEENRSAERFFLEIMKMNEQDELLEQARMLIARLERVSVDSIWARRSSGVRGALLKWVERLENCREYVDHSLSPQEQQELELSVKSGFEYLARAARDCSPQMDNSAQ